MGIQRFQRSIRFSSDEWTAVREAAESRNMSPAMFVREASARAAAEELDLDEGRLTPELTDILMRTFRGVHLLAFLKREQCDQAGKVENFERAADAARAAEDAAFGREERASDR